ncbi:hypothetical protein GQ57_17035 [Burkholderia sp. MSh2]|uniref:Uncharacterized protein n=1 Tax=Burkholderia paludis TaxID=1506587 RepID=A0A6J5F406_9BURK|nr:MULTISPECIES: hypothetical protein [Burkholderia]KEZ04779.1 hypothetical protein GQ57_17035 [Burkholderia sp. MSh2]CAB3773498.1 hypothetical protein LMG30113_07183 [Burkholderia paludis]VWC28718.1 hypothetical protein BPA30113_06157 [Burkholderia paludis]
MLREIDIFGLLLSPIAMMVLVSLVGTGVIAPIVNRLIPHRSSQHENLLYILIFTGLLAVMVGNTF